MRLLYDFFFASRCNTMVHGMHFTLSRFLPHPRSLNHNLCIRSIIKIIPISTMWVSRAYGLCVCARVRVCAVKMLSLDLTVALAPAHFLFCCYSLCGPHSENLHRTHWKPIHSTECDENAIDACTVATTTLTYDRGRMHTAIQCILISFDGARSAYLLARFCTDNFHTSNSSIQYDTMGYCVRKRGKEVRMKELVATR